MSEPSPVEKRPMPTPTRVAVILLWLLGVVLLAYSLLIWLTQEEQIDASVEAGTDRETAAQILLLYLIAFVIIGLSALLAAIFLPRRRAWARQVGLLTTSLLVVMSLFGALAAGGISPVGLLVLIASIAGLTSLVSRQTKDWMRGVVRTD